MVHHTKAVARGATQVPILADLPYRSYESPVQTVENGARLIEAGAHAVKLEGGASHVAQIRALVEAGIPVMAHIGMLPQSVREEGGYRIKGKTEEGALLLLEDARAAEEAGAFGLLLELVHSDTARRITDAVKIPTIGIGAGQSCDGQVLVLHDLVGLFPWFTPKFAQPRARVAADIIRSAAEFVTHVKSAAPAEAPPAEAVGTLIHTEAGQIPPNQPPLQRD
jgi:3-methyl-2-oxobutanoate hydroxymethyltransferase